MSKFHDDHTQASDSLPLTISEAKLRRLQPNLFGWRSLFAKTQWGKRKLSASGAREMIAEHLQFGDSRAAVVMQTSPRLIVAAYTDEQDAVLLLNFPTFLVRDYQLQNNSRLLTVNTYGRGNKPMRDIVQGPASTGQWMNCYPIIADFLSDDLRLIAERKKLIPETEWNRAFQFAKALMAEPAFTIREGSPLRSRYPGTLISNR